MGVTGLWQIVQPCARPIKIETLNRKRLAVDASIWIYQFLKAVRDKEGNALRNSHVVGFFRRICKLLFFGIKPVFVFDGGAPALKRQTVSARKSRREGRREDAVRTAGKLLAVQMQRRAEEEEAQRRAHRDQPVQQEESVPDENLVYVDELGMSQQERQQNRKFRKKDQYHLPELEVSMSEMGGPNDPRIMSLEDLQAYARQFDTGEDINVYDFSKIDYESSFFTSLPASDRYNILNAARLRSRLRMGHSKEQLDTMFPDRMAFSKFQIERVRERNELTQRLMHLNGFEGAEFAINGPGRVAGEKGREYVLVKNDGVEGGWALGVISDEGREERPIDVDKPLPSVRFEADEDGEDEDAFEDVPIEGLNRLPKSRTREEELSAKLLKQRRAIYQSRGNSAKRKPRTTKRNDDEAPLFVQSSDEENMHLERVGTTEELFGGEIDQANSDDEELRRAIQMSLEHNAADDAIDQPAPATESPGAHAEDEDMLSSFQQTAAAEQRPVPKGSGRAIANLFNKRAFDAAPESREITSFGVPTQKPDSSDDEDSMDLQAALSESRKTKRKTSPPRRPLEPPQPSTPAAKAVKAAGFSGPLPFEKLDLGSSLLGKKKLQERSEATAGGFENPELARKETKKNEPLPPWFSGDLGEGMKAQKAIEAEDRQKAKEFNSRFRFQEKGGSSLRRTETVEVIDLEANDADDDSETSPKHGEIVDLEDGQPQLVEHDPQTVLMDDTIRMGHLADKLRVEPAKPSARFKAPEVPSNLPDSGGLSVANNLPIPTSPVQEHLLEDEDEVVDWSDSNEGGIADSYREMRRASNPSPHASVHVQRRAPSEEFEDVQIPDIPEVEKQTMASTPQAASETEAAVGHVSASGLAAQNSKAEDFDEFDDFSDPEEQEMLRALAAEAEEHARFASQLNNKSHAQNIQDYEKELKQLRNQQKKDRRDADEVTHIMITECQQLLRLFGLPYITAPMEAEAQCAELVSLGLVDGIVTDDSDCFLFGGTRIYKNMFNQAKFVECYLTSDLEKEFDLTRDKLISVAHLLGSDYTEGLPGVGPVTALEIISEFQDLEEFKTWWTAVQMQIIPKSDDASNAFRKKFRRNATKLFLPPTFPDQRVAVAYTNPDVDHDPEAFQWGVPDLAALRSFLMATIGWSQERTDEVLVPVIKDMNRRMDEGTQANITAFFDGTIGIGAAGATNAGKGEGYAPRKRVDGSKRMGGALNRLSERAKLKRNASLSQAGESHASIPDPGTEDTAMADPTTRKVAKKRKASRRAASDAQVHSSEDEDEDGGFVEQTMRPRKRVERAQRGRGGGKKQDALHDIK